MEGNNAGVTGSKNEIRKHILRVRDGIRPEDKVRFDAGIRERVLKLSVYREAQVILAYASYRSEVDTMLLIRQALEDGKEVFVPKVDGDEMEFWQIRSLAELESGYRGIPEPVQRKSLPEWALHKHLCPHCTERLCQGGQENRSDGDDEGQAVIGAMMWLPGVAFDRERHRIGYGRGFYDRYLSRLSDAGKQTRFKDSVLRLTTAALAYSCQIVQKIPYEPHDIRPDLLITETEI